MSGNSCVPAAHALTAPALRAIVQAPAEPVMPVTVTISYVEKSLFETIQKLPERTGRSSVVNEVAPALAFVAISHASVQSGARIDSPRTRVRKMQLSRISSVREIRAPRHLVARTLRKVATTFSERDRLFRDICRQIERELDLAFPVRLRDEQPDLL